MQGWWNIFLYCIYLSPPSSESIIDIWVFYGCLLGVYIQSKTVHSDLSSISTIHMGIRSIIGANLYIGQSSYCIDRHLYYQVPCRWPLAHSIHSSSNRAIAIYNLMVPNLLYCILYPRINLMLMISKALMDPCTVMLLI